MAMDPSHDDSPVIFISVEGQPGIEIGLDQVSPGAIARAFSVSVFTASVTVYFLSPFIWSPAACKQGSLYRRFCMVLLICGAVLAT